jgi:hypothetical protein
VTAATRRRLRGAVLALPMSQRERHLSALACLLHLLDHVPEGRQPVRVVLGRDVDRIPELRWAAEQLGQPIAACVDPACTDATHVTMETTPLTMVAAEVAR